MGNRILSLQSMRLIASLTVLQYHLWNNYLDVTFLHPGTDFFIVLVGMVAALSEARLIPQGGWSRYILGRYLRLYVTFVPVFFLYLISGRDSLSLEFVTKSFFFIPINGQLPLVGVSWMLAMFLVFYWLFSLAFIFRQERMVVPIFGIWLAACLIRELLDVHFPIFDKGFQIMLDIRSAEFLLGYLGGWLVRSHKISKRMGGWLFALGILTLIPSIWLLNSAEYATSVRVFLYGTTMTLIATGLAGQEKGGVESPLLWVMTHPWLVWLGGTSYVLYLTHNMLLRVWDALIPITPIQVPLITAVMLAAAAMGYQLWEKPVLAALRHKWFPKPESIKMIKNVNYEST
jgi:peptidoglycan/LPS O-acetylase OafA/YrhL